MCLFSCFSYQALDHVISAQHYIFICGLSDYQIFPHYLINGEIFGNKLLYIKCVT